MRPVFTSCPLIMVHFGNRDRSFTKNGRESPLPVPGTFKKYAFTSVFLKNRLLSGVTSPSPDRNRFADIPCQVHHIGKSGLRIPGQVDRGHHLTHQQASISATLSGKSTPVLKKHAITTEPLRNPSTTSWTENGSARNDNDETGQLVHKPSKQPLH